MVCGPRWVPLYLYLRERKKKRISRVNFFKVFHTAEAICSMDHLDLESLRSFRRSLDRYRMIYAC